MKALVIAAALAASTIVAGAADIQRPVYKAAPVMTAYNWSGFYAGINAGWGQNVEQTNLFGTDAFSSGAIDIGVIPGSLDPRQQGWVVGGQAGYRWQMGAFVYGADLEFNWSDVNGGRNDVFTLSPLGIPASVTTTTNSELNWYGTLAGTIGFAFDRVLVYGKGGVAYGEIRNEITNTLSTPIAPLNGTATGSFDGKEWGWVVGAGIEAALVGGWTIGAEYTYLDFGQSSVAYGTTIAGANIGFVADRDNTFHMVKGRLNYRF